MEDVIINILEKISFRNKEQFAALLNKCLEVMKENDENKLAKFDSLRFRLDVFFAGFSPFVNSYGKGQSYRAGVEALMTVCEEIGVDLDAGEAFILYHIRNAGKFRLDEEKIHKELKGLWGEYKEFALADIDFSFALKSLMKSRFISYRKRNIHLNPVVTFHYKKDDY